MSNQAIRLGLSLILVSLLLGIAPTRLASRRCFSPADASDTWWDNGWPYRIRVDVSGSGIASANINFTTQLDTLGLNHALLDLRSVRVVPTPATRPAHRSPMRKLQRHAERW